MSHAPKPPPAPSPMSLETELKSAVRRVMNGQAVEARDVAKVQEILDRKAFQIRAPFIEKLRKAKASP
jgi:hypothetical protein